MFVVLAICHAERGWRLAQFFVPRSSYSAAGGKLLKAVLCSESAAHAFPKAYLCSS